MLCVPDRESYLTQIPKFFIFVGEVLLRWVSLRISPFTFLTFFSCLRKYQNRDLATTSSGAKIVILYTAVFSLLFERGLPMISNSFSSAHLNFMTLKLVVIS